MTDKELLYIKTVAEEGSVTRAAEILHIAQPSLTQTIRRVERQVDTPVFVRTRTGVALTEAGHIVYTAACEMLKIYLGALDQVKELKAVRSSHISVGASWYATVLLLTRAVTQLHRKHPRVEVRLVEKNTAELLRLLREKQLDAAIIHQFPDAHPDCARERGITTRPLLTERFCVAAHAQLGLDSLATPLPNGELELEPAQLDGVPLVMFSPAQRVRRVADFVFAQAGLAPQGFLTTYGFPSALDLVAQGAGAALLPELYARHETALEAYKNVRLYSLPEQYVASWTTAVCCRRGEKAPDAVTDLITLLKKAQPYA